MKTMISKMIACAFMAYEKDDDDDDEGTSNSSSFTFHKIIFMSLACLTAAIRHTTAVQQP